MLVLVLVVIFLISFIYYSRRQNALLFKLKHVPYLEQDYPFIGIGYLLISKSPEEIFNFLINIFAALPSDVTKFFIFTKLFMVFKSPTHIQKILSSPNCLEKGSNYSTIPFQNGLITAKPTLWKNHRKLLNPTLHITLFHKFMQQFNKAAHLLVANLQCKPGREIFDIKQFVIDRTIGLQLESVFDVDIGDKEIRCITDHFNTLQKMVGDNVINFFKYFVFNFIGKLFKTKLQIERHVEEILTEYEPFVKMARKQYLLKPKMDECSEGNIRDKPEALIHKVIVLEDMGYFTNQDVKYHIATMLFTGSDTIAMALSNCILCLAMNQLVQEQCVNEIKSVMGDKFKTISIDDLTKLELVERTINESLRLLPPIPAIARRCDEDFQLDDNIIIPAGTELIIPIIVIHRCKEYWGDNPTKFDPDNFLPENVAKRPLLSYIPFSYGNRNCIAKKYSQFALKVFLSHLLINYKFSADLKFEDLKIAFGISLIVTNKHMIRIEKR